MKQFIDKLIERLEEELILADKEKERCVKESPLQFDSEKGYASGVSTAIKIVNQLAEEYKKPTITVKQLIEPNPKLEEFLKEDSPYTVEFVDDNNGWIPVSSGKLPDDGVPVDVTVREDTDNGGYDLYVFESWYQEGRWAIDKNRYNPTVIAWKPKDAPYQPKGGIACQK